MRGEGFCEKSGAIVNIAFTIATRVAVTGWCNF